MPGEKGSNPMGSPPPVDLQRSVEEMTRMVQELRDAEKTARRRSMLMTLLLVAVILLFAMLTFNTVRDNFTQQKLQQAAAERARIVLPQLQPHAQAVINEVARYYAEVGQERLRTLGPKLDARVRDQADRLGQELEQKINAQVEASFGRITDAAFAQIAKDFPAMYEDGGARATQRLKAAVTEETGKLGEHTRNLYKTQFERIAGALSHFPVPDVSNTGMDTLHRQLLHELLMFADYELTVQTPTAPQAPLMAEAQK